MANNIKIIQQIKNILTEIFPSKQHLSFLDHLTKVSSYSFTLAVISTIA